MKVLIACEESQRVCIAFRDKGHEAFSCDIQECSGGHPEWHIQEDALKVAYSYKWELMIGHPPCTKISNAGARWLYKSGVLNQDRLSEALLAKNFFMSLLNAPISKIAIENPLPSSIVGLPIPSQIIQPYQFGEPYSKKLYYGSKDCLY